MRGLRIVFWSPRHGLGLTSGMLAASAAITMLSDADCVLTEAGHYQADLSEAVRGSACTESGSMLSGIDAAMRSFKAGPLSPGALEEYTVALSDRLSLFSGISSIPAESLMKPITRQLVNRIFELMELSFDFVVTDVGCDDSILTHDLIEHADVAVIMLKQDRRLISEALSMSQFEDKPKVYMFDRYEPDSRYGLSNLRAMFKELGRRNTFILPDSASYMDAIHEGRAIDYIREGLATDGDSGDAEFFSALREMGEGIIRLCREFKSHGTEGV